MLFKHSAPQKHILIFGWGKNKGGLTTAFIEFARFLAEQGFTLSIIEINSYKTNFKYAVSGHHMLINDANLISKLASIFKIQFILMILKPNIYVSIGLHNSANLVARLLPKSTFKILHDVTFRDSLSDKRLLNSLKYFSAIAPQAPPMEAIYRQSNLDILVKSLPCMTYLIDSAYAQKDPCNEFPKLAYFGRLAENKGIEIIINAVINLSGYTMFTLDIWGDGTTAYKNHIEILAASCQNITLKGPYPDPPRNFDLMSTYDGLLFSSTSSEGLPLCIVEALGCGLPILTSGYGAIREVICKSKDSIISMTTIEAYTQSLMRFLDKIKNKDFSRIRQRLFYEKCLSRELCENEWRKCINNPRDFFLS